MIDFKVEKSYKSHWNCQDAISGSWELLEILKSASDSQSLVILQESLAILYLVLILTEKKISLRFFNELASLLSDLRKSFTITSYSAGPVLPGCVCVYIYVYRVSSVSELLRQ